MITTKPRNIKDGDFTYGERIELGRIMADPDMGDYERIRQMMLCLHEIDCTPETASELTDYATQIAEGVAFWVEQEREQLHIPPTSEETQAGIDQLSRACGDMGNVVTMAETFQCSFEEVFNKPYPEVFTILKVHTERAKYERRLNAVYAKKRG